MVKIPLQTFLDEVEAFEGVSVAIGPPAGARRIVPLPTDVLSYRHKYAAVGPVKDTGRTGAVVRRVLRCLDDCYTVSIIHPLTKQPWITGRNAFLSTVREMRSRVKSQGAA